MISLLPLDRPGIAWAQDIVTRCHYRRSPVDGRSSVEGYAVQHDRLGRVGLLLFGRPEATVCRPWYGSVAEAQNGRVACTRWQVLNLARVWMDPKVQKGGKYCTYEYLPGFTDRSGYWRSALASTAIRMATRQIGMDYLLRRPPCFLDEPYQIDWLLSYCDPAYHKGVIYRESGFELYRTNGAGLMTWRIRLPGLIPEQDQAVREASVKSPRSRAYRAKRAQLSFEIAGKGG